MGVGLWLSDVTAKQLLHNEDDLDAFSRFLQDEGLEPFTFNGFPFGNFHQPVVKHAVYHPTWLDNQRLEYTQNLANLIHRLAPPGDASISTLPIAWGTPALSPNELTVAAEQFKKLTAFLADFERQTGRLIYVCIEPEPGCTIQYARDVVHFFENHLLNDAVNEAEIRRHIRVCHDVCHSVVMAESQLEALTTYQRAGLEIGKIQISSAVWVDFDAIDDSDKSQVVSELERFAEDRYLHQTTVQHNRETAQFYEDLPLALDTIDSPESAAGVWRIHFHVPVYLERFGQLRASQQEIIDCISLCRQHSSVKHFEVETYAWNVLPQELQQENLADGIAQELKWFKDVAQQPLSFEHE